MCMQMPHFPPILKPVLIVSSISYIYTLSCTELCSYLMALSYIYISLVIILYNTLVWGKQSTVSVHITSPSNSSVIDLNSFTISVHAHAVASSSIVWSSVGLCIYPVYTIDGLFNASQWEDPNRGFPTPAYNCYGLEPDIHGDLNASLSVHVNNSLSATLQYVCAVIDIDAAQRGITRVLGQDIVIFDVLNSADPMFYGINDKLVDMSRAWNNKPLHVAVFFKDLDVQGCNMRMMRYGCYTCRSQSSAIRVSFIIAQQGGLLLEKFAECDCPLVFIPRLHVDSMFVNTMHQLDPDVVAFLRDVDVLLAGNTFGDPQTNVLFNHVLYLRNLGEASPSVVLDLCNLYDIAEAYADTWTSVVDGLLAPSLYVARHSTSVTSGKRVELVYPACEEQTTFTPLPWPRRSGGKYQVGFFGRVSFDLNPGLFIRTVAHLYSTFPHNYLNDNFEFVVVGTGPMLAYIQELTHALQMSDHIHFYGYRSDFHELLCKADLVVNPKCRGETFGITHTEAMVCGTPLIAFNRSGSQESIHPLASHLLDTVSVEALAEAIVIAYERPEVFRWTANGMLEAAREMYHMVDPWQHSRLLSDALKRIHMSRVQ